MDYQILNSFITLASVVIIIIFAISVHEASHAFVAKICGDKTAFMLGRATLNPVKHIDPVGTILVPALTYFLGGVMFGWAKPVPIDYSRLRDQKVDPALVAAAGPFSNFAMALMFAVLYFVCVKMNADAIALKIMTTGMVINISFMVLNLLPILPLDGGRIVSTFLPYDLARKFDAIEPYGMWIVIALAMTGVLGKIMYPITSSILSVLI